MIEKPNKLIAIYGRVSTSNQENEGTIETQLSAVREFAQKNSLAIVKEYTDEGWSGDSIVRPNLDQLRVDAKKKLWEAVLMYDPDRLARRYSYQELIIDELRDAGIEVIFVTVSAPKNSEDKILHGVRGLFAEYERAKISERFRLGKLRKVKEGHILVSEALYGYRYILKKDAIHGYYEINEEEARVVRMIFTWIADEGYTLRRVVRKLQELGIKPRKSKRGVWSTSTLSTLLRNKAYIGEARWGSSYAVVPVNPTNTEKYRKMKKSSRRNKPEAEWIASKFPVPVIIDRALFDRARLQLETNFALCQRNKKNEYLLSGRIRCICGCTRGGEGPQHGKHLYYRCANRVNNFPLPRTCVEKGINARIADWLVWEKIADLMTSPALLAKQANRWSDSPQHKAESAVVGDVATMEKEIGKLKVQEDRYNKAYGAGLLTLEQLKEYSVSLRESVGSLRTQISLARQEASRVEVRELPDRQEIQKFTVAVRKMLRDLSFQRKRAIVLNTVEKIIGTQQQLQIHGYIPITNYVEFFTGHRYCRFTQRW